MRFAVMATGAVGGYLAARLATAGHDVLCFARGDHLTALRTNGLVLNSDLGNVVTRDLVVAGDGATHKPVDVVFVTVKIPDNEAAATEILPLLRDDTAVITFQNGIESPELFAKLIGGGRVVGGAAFISAVIEAPGVIHHGGQMARFTFGELGGGMSPRVEAVHNAFLKAEMECQASDSIMRVLWAKFVFISAASGTNAAFRSSMSEIVANKNERAVLKAAMTEAAMVARAYDVELPDDIVARQMTIADGFPAGQKASMAYDLDMGKPLELPWLSGAVSRLGRARGVATPVSDALTGALMPWVHGASLRT